MARLRTISKPGYLATSLGVIFIKFDADAILGFMFDLVVRAEMLFLPYLTSHCFAINLIKFANNPRVPYAQISGAGFQIRLNLTRKLAAQTPEISSNLLKYQKRRFEYVSDYLKRRK